MKRIILLLLITAYILSSNIFAQKQISKNHKFENIKCSLCHINNSPTAKNPSLRPCPRIDIMNTFTFSKKGPDSVEINSIQKIYSAVKFPHKLHAEMSKISGGCLQCHHYNISEELHSCSFCHDNKRKREDISKPDLKGAYHQQCMNCHREWSHKTECNSCHTPIGDKNISSFDKKKVQIEKQHKPLKTPTKIVFSTKSTKGNKVTFYHDEHVNLFGFDCKDCHKNEVCIRCHDLRKTSVNEIAKSTSSTTVASEEHEHTICQNCHKIENNCSNCHSNNEAEPFNHAKKTGWKLNRYHKILSCQACHGNKIQYSKLNNQCGNCHSNWDSDNFNHKITGIILSEDHIDADCEDCHLDRNYSAKPTCENCHDEKSYPKEIPGNLVKKNRKK